MGTASIVEIIWTLVAVPGLYLWARSAVDAGKTMRAVKAKGIGNGRRTVARLATGLTRTMVTVEAVFFGLGVLSMFLPPNPGSTELARLLIAAVLTGASVGVTVLAFRWRRAEEYLLRESAARATERADLAHEHERQNARGTAQDVRSVAQDDRSVQQGDRDVRQSLRGAAQDRRGAEQDKDGAR